MEAQLEYLKGVIAQLAKRNNELAERNSELVEKISDLSHRLEIALNVIEQQKEEIQVLRDEIARLKGQKPKPKIPESRLEGPNSKDKQSSKNSVSRGKHPRRKKKNNLHIHSEIPLLVTEHPAGAVHKGFKKYTVQDLVFQPHNTVYKMERLELLNGSYITAKLPENIKGHYGPNLRAFILNLYYGCRVTEELLLTLLKGVGIGISAGQLSNILTKGHEEFHQEKNDLLDAGISAFGQIKVDDTGARHNSQNGYSTIIGNDYFTYIVSTDSKSRINFLRILHGDTPQYLVNADTADYIENIKPDHHLKTYLSLRASETAMNKTEWDNFLIEANICTEGDVRLATEAALFASLIKKGIPKDLGVHGDDAGQFNAFIRSLCWVHEERHYRKLMLVDEEARQALEQVRDDIWNLYRGLQEYKLAPREALREKLDTEFDDLFLRKKTCSYILNHQLAKTYSKKAELLRVLERPETPLHNNGTETDAREMVVKRKISGGTRSAWGRKSRDTFISLKKTCVKLQISFWAFLEDRIFKYSKIPKLATIVLARSIKPAPG